MFINQWMTRPNDKPYRVAYSGPTNIYLWVGADFIFGYFCFFWFVAAEFDCRCGCPNVSVWYLSPINLRPAFAGHFLPGPGVGPCSRPFSCFSLNSNALSAQLIADYANQMRDICVVYDNIIYSSICRVYDIRFVYNI